MKSQTVDQNSNELMEYNSNWIKSKPNQIHIQKAQINFTYKATIKYKMKYQNSFQQNVATPLPKNLQRISNESSFYAN